MDIRHLRYFVEVSRTRSFTEAAEALHTTQPTVSKAIKELESFLGMQLFARSGKRAELTADGYKVLGQAKDVVQAFHQLSMNLHQVAQELEGSITIGLSPMAGRAEFARVIVAFHSLYPRITLSLAEYGAKKVEMEIEQGKLDMGVVLLPTKQDLYEIVPFIEEKLMVILPLGHRLAKQSVVSLRQLADESFILLKEDFALHERVIALCVSLGFRPKIALESSQWPFIADLVAEGLGISLLPQCICEQIPANRAVALPVIEPEIPWQLALAWRKDRYLPLAAREWIMFLKSVYVDQAVKDKEGE